MNTCSTCRHWTDRHSSIGICNLISPDGDSGTDLVRVSGWDEDYDPLFMTRGTFGCTLHEPLDDAT